MAGTNLESLRKEIGKDDVSRILVEYILELKYKSDKFDELARALRKKDATIESVRKVLEAHD